MKILVVKLADLGDLLTSEPAIRSLRTAFPDARIDILTTPHAGRLAELMSHGVEPVPFDKHVFDTVRIPGVMPALSLARLGSGLALGRYDRVVLLHHLVTRWGAAKFRALVAATHAPLVAGLDNGRGSFLTHRVTDRGFGFRHEARYMLEVAVAAGGARVDPEPAIEPDLRLTPDGLPERFVAIAPKAGDFSSAREWPLDRFIQVSERLAAGGQRLIVIGGPDAVEAGDQIAAATSNGAAVNLAGKTTLAETAAVLGRASVLIGNDSFPGHLAAAVGTPVVSIFGPSNHLAWAPRARDHERGRIARADIPCSPCLYTGHRLGRREGCPLRTCLQLVEPETVYQATMELLSA